jgi:methyl-accepting chemotaxis protein
VLIVLVPGLMVTMALGLQASEQARANEASLQAWQFASARLETSVRSVEGELFQWNEAVVDGEIQAAAQVQSQITRDVSTADSTLVGIGALNLAGDTTANQARQADALAAFGKFAVAFTAGGPHTDADLQASIAGADKAWSTTSNQLAQYIQMKVETSSAVVDAHATYSYDLVLFGIVLFVVGGGILALIQFVSTLSPVARLAGIANTLAAGRQAAIPTTRRIDEIGQLTGALATWQESVGGALYRLRSELASSVTTLSVAAQELASVTLEQTTAATATSANMDLLARSSEEIAVKIDRVALQAGQTRSSLELAQADLRASGDRTLALAGRVDEIEGILQLINDIADQTNLLALNAAIEAARAGDAGRGFAVVADEVRRLAERCKAASADIARLVAGAQAQSSDTIMALEKGVKQMERGLAMMQEMSDLSAQVQAATQQQRSSTAEFVVALESMAEGSRSVAGTAQEIASAAASQGQLAADLAGS